MEWNVFYYSINARKITTMNIFDHCGFRADVENALKKFESKEEFAKELKSSLMYCFWCKSEYEIIISPFGCALGVDNLKVDIYTQVMNNWGIFLDYVWGYKHD